MVTLGRAGRDAPLPGGVGRHDRGLQRARPAGEEERAGAEQGVGEQEQRGAGEREVATVVVVDRRGRGHHRGQRGAVRRDRSAQGAVLPSGGQSHPGGERTAGYQENAAGRASRAAGRRERARNATT